MKSIIITAQNKAISNNDSAESVLRYGVIAVRKDQESNFDVHIFPLNCKTPEISIHRESITAETEDSAFEQVVEKLKKALSDNEIRMEPVLSTNLDALIETINKMKN